MLLKCMLISGICLHAKEFLKRKTTFAFYGKRTTLFTKEPSHLMSFRGALLKIVFDH